MKHEESKLQIACVRVDIKPLSVNEAWKGQRFKTDKYKKYERSVLFLLPKLKVPDGKLSISITWGFSSKASDIDNPTKLVLDILQKKYGFNDKDIYELHLTKTIVKNGEDFFEVIIKELK